MQANEAPEKIYVHKSQYWGLMANASNTTQNDVEYVRKDVFIEKAATYIQQHRMRNTTMIENSKNILKKSNGMSKFNLPCPQNNDKECEHCQGVNAQDGWKFKGCFFPPNKGKFVGNIKECPLKEKENVDSKR